MGEKIETNYYESKKLAQCFITKLDSEIKFPPEIIESLSPLGNNVVAVIPGDSKKLTFFLTNATRVLFVRVLLDKASLNEGFFTSLRETMTALTLENLFSTGICFKDEICVWEGVFEYEDDSNYAQVQSKMAAITHVNSAKFEKIEL